MANANDKRENTLGKLMLTAIGKHIGQANELLKDFWTSLIANCSHKVESNGIFV